MSKVALVQLDNRSDAALGPLAALIMRNHAYAAARGYTHVLVRQPSPDMPVYWNKVQVIADHLAQGYDIVAWLDSDAVVHDFSLDIEALFQGDEAFLYAGDVPVWERISPFNAGVFFAKGAFGLSLMREWLALYPAAVWRKQDGQWNDREHLWAGPAFEQGAFAENLYPRYVSDPRLRQLPWQRLQSPYPMPGALTLHFQSMFRCNLMVYLGSLAGR